jgi:hypothetical protein
MMSEEPKKPRGHHAFLRNALRHEVGLSADKIADLAKSALDTTGDVVQSAVNLEEALRKQLQEYLPRLKVDQLLFLSLKIAEMTGDKSFLENWQVLSAEVS